MKRLQRAPFIHMKKQGEVSCLYRELGLHQNLIMLAPKTWTSTSRTTSNKFLLLFTSHSTHGVLLEQPGWTNTHTHCTDEETKDQKSYTTFPESGGYQGVSTDSKPTMRNHSHTHISLIPPLTNSSKNSCSRALHY